MANPYAQFAAPVASPDAPATPENPYAQFAPKPKAKSEQVGTLAALAEGAGQGVTLGFSDEIEGAGRALISKLTGDSRSFGELYTEGVAVPRARQKAAKETAGGTYLIGELGAGLALPFGAARAMGAAAKAAPGVAESVGGVGRAIGFGQMSANAGAGLGARTVAGAREGVAYGTVAGFGSGEGSIENRLGNAAIGAAAGGALGAVAPAAIDVAGTIGGGMLNRARASISPEKFGHEKVAEAMIRDGTAELVTRTPGGAARVTPEAALDHVLAKFDSMQASGKPVMLVDAAGENTRSLLRGASNLPSPERQMLKTKLAGRQADQWVRIEDDLTATLAPGRQFGQTVDDLVAARAKEATPAFDAAYNQPFNIGANSQLDQFFVNRPYMQRLAQKTGENIAGMQGVNPAQTKPWEFLHRVKMQIDREIANLKRGQQDAVSNWSIRDLTQLKNEYVRLLGNENKQLGSALSRYSDESSLINAANDGLEEFTKLSAHEIRKKVAGMSPQEAQMYQLGAARALMNDIERSPIGNDSVRRIFERPGTQERLTAMFGVPEQAALASRPPTARELAAVEARQRFVDRIDLEGRMFETNRAVNANSTTARQLGEMGEMGQAPELTQGVAQVAQDIALQGWRPAIANFLGRSTNNVAQGITPRTAGSMINTAMANDPATIQQALQRMAEREAARDKRRANTVAGILSGYGAAQSSNGP